MQISSPAPHCVIQRGRNDTAALTISGRCAAPGGAPVQARIDGLHDDWVPMGSVRAGAFTGRLSGVPIGGPYDLQVQVGGETGVVRDILVGDLFILAGQSNMDGCGKFVGTESPSRLVRCFGYDDRWSIARDPLCRYEEAVDPVHWRIDKPREAAIQEDRDFRTTGAGLGVRFGKEISRRHGVPVGLLACSHGGTSLAQWSPSRRDEGGRSLYGSLLRRVRACGTSVRGILWYQGESDCCTAAEGLAYRDTLRGLIEALRADLKQPRLPFMQVQLACYYGDAAPFPHWNDVQTAQIAVESDLPLVATVAAVDLELSDAIHVGTAGLRTLGVRLAHLADMLVYGDRSRQIGPRLKSAAASPDRMSVEVRFSGVNGSLRPSQGIQGFSLWEGERQIPVPDRRVAGPQTVRLALRDPLPDGALLWYGRGLNPCVSLHDGAGLACPVFGPVPL